MTLKSEDPVKTRAAKKPKSARPRSKPDRAATSKSGSKQAVSFVIEPLEPRILFSADLAPTAQMQIQTGLHDLQAALAAVSAVPPATTQIPFVDRSAAQFAALGDPLSAIAAPVQSYFDTNKTTATLEGLASALNQIPNANAQVVTLQNGDERINLDLKPTAQTSSTAITLANETPVSLLLQSPQTAQVSTTTNLSLQFGIDSATQQFVVGSGKAVETVEASGSLSGGLTFAGVQTTLGTGSTASVDATLEADLTVASTGPGLTDSQITSDGPAQLATTTLTDSGTIELKQLTSPSLTEPEDVTVASVTSTAKGAATVTYDTPNSQLSGFVNATLPGLDTLADDIRQYLTQIQDGINGANALGSSLPFVGKNLAAASDFFSAIQNKLTDLQTTLDTDVAKAGGAILDKLHDDLESFFSGLGVEQADPIVYYVQNGTTLQQHDGTVVNAGKVSAIEVDLKLGSSSDTDEKAQFDIGLPGLEFKTGSDSQIDVDVGWTLDFGFGVDATGAYLVTDGAGKDQASIALSATLSPGFNAVGTIGFLQALLTEPDGDVQHTGLSGTIGVQIAASSGGAGALASGDKKLYLTDLGDLVQPGNLTPDFDIKAHSALNVALGFDFELQNGQYVDISDFPSLTAKFKFDWDLSGTSITSGAAPSVGFDNLTLDYGELVNKFIKNLLGPIAPLIDDLYPVSSFALQPVPVLDDVIQAIYDVAGKAAQTGIDQELPSYQAGQHYTWLNLFFDETGLPSNLFPVVYNLFDAVNKLHDLLAGTTDDIGLSLGSFDFGGKDLRLPRESAGDLSDAQNYAGLSDIDSGDLSQYITGLFGGSGVVGTIEKTVQSALNSLDSIGQDVAGDDPGSATASNGDDFSLTFGFPIVDDPTSIVGLLFGQDVNLVDVNLMAHFGDSLAIPLFGLELGPLSIGLLLDLSYDFQLNFQLGYDTRGITDFFDLAGQDAAKGITSHQASDFLDGVYISTDPLNDGKKHPLIDIDGSIYLSLGVDLVIASAEVRGGLGADLAVNLDGDEDNGNKIHLSDADFSNTGDFAETGEIGPFMFSGKIYAEIYLEASIGIDPFSISTRLDILPYTVIFSFPETATEPNLIYPLAFYHTDSGELDLYVGSQASRRFDTNISKQYDHDFAQNQEYDSEHYDVDVYDDSFTITAYFQDGETATQTVTGHGHPTLIKAVAGNGNDEILVNDHTTTDHPAVYLDGGTGNDTLAAGNGGGTLIGGAYLLSSDYKQGTTSATPVADSSHDLIYGGLGDDTIYGNGPKSIGNDPNQSVEVIGGGGNDLIVGTDGNDTIYTGTGNDSVNAGGGNDVVYAYGGQDTLDGGGGRDTIDFTNEDAGVDADLAAGTLTQGAAQPGAISNFVVAVGSQYADTIIGDGADDLFYGGAGNDLLVGGGGHDSLYGQAGDDTILAGDQGTYIEGGSGNDSIVGGAGADTIYGDMPGTPSSDSVLQGLIDGNDTIFGGAGDDSIIAGDGNDSVDGQAGNDSILAGDGNSTILGNDGNDTIVAGNGANLIDGGTGNDSIVAGGGRNVIYGNDGNDSILAGNGGDWVDGGAGDDTIRTGLGADTIQGGADDDTIYGGGGGDLIYGDDSLGLTSGNDLIYGDSGTILVPGQAALASDGNDTIFGGAGNDTIYGEGGNDLIDGGAGNDWINGGYGNDTIYGEAGNDTIYGGTDLLVGSDLDADLIYGGDDADTIYGQAGNDTIYGGGGDDLIDGGAGDDSIFGEAGNDTIYGQSGNDYIDGGDDDDVLAGGDGNDTIFGGEGRDLIDGGTGDDVLHGDEGDGTAVLLVGAPAGTDADTIYGDAGNDSISGDQGDDLVDGGAGNDQIDGGQGNNLLYGGDGDDTLSAGAGNDTIYGGAGDDSLIGGAGDDFLDGGTGVNILHGGDGDDTLTVAAGVGNQLFGEGGNDLIYGSPDGADSNPNVLTGAPQGDIISGGDGNDTIFGNGGADIIDGGAGNDLIDGGAGGDLILGGLGDDTITGGDGNDTIYGDAGSDSITGDAGNDLIYGNDGSAAPGADSAPVNLKNLPGLVVGADGHLTTGVTQVAGDLDQDTILGGGGNDSLYGEAGVDYLDGGTGADLVDGGAGEDMILGGGGAGDSLYGGADADVIIGSDDGGDLIHGGDGNDRIQGQGGNDTLFGDAGDDVIDGGAGADLVQGGLGRDLLVGGAGNDTLYGQGVDDTGDDNAADTLFGDFGTNGNEVGSGADVLYGQGGNDVLYGEGGVDLVDPGAGGGDVYDAAEAVGTSAYVAPPATPQVAPLPVPAASATVALPSDSAGLGWWSPIAGPDGLTLGAGSADARDLSLAATTAGPVAAWTQDLDGLSGLYVATKTGDAWQGLAGSDEGHGIAGLTGAAANPNVATSGTDVYVAWTSTSAAGTSIDLAHYDPSADGGAGAWSALGTSLGAGGVSGYGAVDDAHVLVTADGPVVLWRDAGDGDALHAARFNGTTWADIGAGPRRDVGAGGLCRGDGRDADRGRLERHDRHGVRARVPHLQRHELDRTCAAERDRQPGFRRIERHAEPRLLRRPTVRGLGPARFQHRLSLAGLRGRRTERHVVPARRQRPRRLAERHLFRRTAARRLGGRPAPRLDRRRRQQRRRPADARLQRAGFCRRASDGRDRHRHRRPARRADGDRLRGRSLRHGLYRHGNGRGHRIRHPSGRDSGRPRLHGRRHAFDRLDPRGRIGPGRRLDPRRRPDAGQRPDARRVRGRRDDRRDRRRRHRGRPDDRRRDGRHGPQSLDRRRGVGDRHRRRASRREQPVAADAQRRDEHPGARQHDRRLGARARRRDPLVRPDLRQHDRRGRHRGFDRPADRSGLRGFDHGQRRDGGGAGRRLRCGRGARRQPDQRQRDGRGDEPVGSGGRARTPPRFVRQHHLEQCARPAAERRVASPARPSATTRSACPAPARSAASISRRSTRSPATRPASTRLSAPSPTTRSRLTEPACTR